MPLPCMKPLRCILPLLLPALIAADRPASLMIQTPPNLKIASAIACGIGGKNAVSGSVSDQGIRFQNLSTDIPYDVCLNLADKTVLQGVNLSWYDDEPAKPDAGDLTDDDRTAIKEIIDVPSFYNHSDILAIRGSHDRATVLVQLVRDKDFYNGAGQIVWRVELWYFQEEFGGWEKVAQQNRVLRRERFKTHDAYEAAVAALHWEPALGGLQIPAACGQLTVKLNADKQPGPSR
jgi:hypothetical protein